MPAAKINEGNIDEMEEEKTSGMEFNGAEERKLITPRRERRSTPAAAPTHPTIS